MARAGAFEGIDAALMIHPAGVNLATMPSICVAEVEVVYNGKSSHASAMPHKRHQRTRWIATRLSSDIEFAPTYSLD